VIPQPHVTRFKSWTSIQKSVRRFDLIRAISWIFRQDAGCSPLTLAVARSLTTWRHVEV